MKHSCSLRCFACRRHWRRVVKAYVAPECTLKATSMTFPNEGVIPGREMVLALSLVSPTNIHHVFQCQANVTRARWAPQTATVNERQQQQTS